MERPRSGVEKRGLPSQPYKDVSSCVSNDKIKWGFERSTSHKYKIAGMFTITCQLRFGPFIGRQSLLLTSIHFISCQCQQPQRSVIKKSFRQAIPHLTFLCSPHLVTIPLRALTPLSHLPIFSCSIPLGKHGARTGQVETLPLRLCYIP